MEEGIDALASNDCQGRIVTNDIVKSLIVNMEWFGGGFIFGNTWR